MAVEQREGREVTRIGESRGSDHGGGGGQREHGCQRHGRRQQFFERSHVVPPCVFLFFSDHCPFSENAAKRRSCKGLQKERVIVMTKWSL